MYVQSVWYYYPDDTQLARSKKFHPEEVFLSDLSDVNTVDNLIGPVEVLSFAEYNKRINSSSSPKKGLEFSAIAFTEFMLRIK